MEQYLQRIETSLNDLERQHDPSGVRISPPPPRLIRREFTRDPNYTFGSSILLNPAVILRHPTCGRPYGPAEMSMCGLRAVFELLAWDGRLAIPG